MESVKQDPGWLHVRCAVRSVIIAALSALLTREMQNASSLVKCKTYRQKFGTRPQNASPKVGGAWSSTLRADSISGADP